MHAGIQVTTDVSVNDKSVWPPTKSRFNSKNVHFSCLPHFITSSIGQWNILKFHRFETLILTKIQNHLMSRKFNERLKKRYLSYEEGWFKWSLERSSKEQKVEANIEGGFCGLQIRILNYHCKVTRGLIRLFVHSKVIKFHLSVTRLPQRALHFPWLKLSILNGWESWMEWPLSERNLFCPLRTTKSAVQWEIGRFCPKSSNATIRI
jgi:hypothetical protein